MSHLFNAVSSLAKKYLKYTLLQSVDFLSQRISLPLRLKTLLLVRLDAIGDYILFRNFIAILKNSDKFKNYEITLCGNLAWRDLAETYDRDFIDNFIWIDKRKFVRNFFYRYKKLREVNSNCFEFAIQPTYSREFYVGDAVIKVSNAKEKIGCSGDLSNMEVWQKTISDSYYTKLISINAHNLLEFYKNKEFFEKLLGEEILIEKPNITINHDDIKNSLGGRYAIIFPGARNERKRWSTDKFAQIAKYLSHKYSLKILVAGSSIEKALSERIISKASDANMLDITGKTTLSEITKLISGADIVISNDTFAAHIAVAVDTRIIYLLTGDHFGRFGPYPKDISEKVYYVYPKEVMDKLDSDLDYLSEKFKYESFLDVNSINVDEVKVLIDQAMIS